MELKFSDGVIIETGWYVLGKGFCIPVADESEADETIVEMTTPK